MPNLSCCVENCVHYCDCGCCKGEIHVSGKQADEAECTCCGSFSERKRDSASNSMSTPKESVSVRCDANNCIYNSDNVCTSPHIDVRKSTDSLSGETQCSTFSKR